MLEIFAYITMFIDHIFKFLNMRINNFNPLIGTLAFPIFAYMVARGIKNTRDRNKYLLRLLIFAFISQIPFVLMVKGLPEIPINVTGSKKILYIMNHFIKSLNVGFTLLLGGMAIQIFERNKENIINRIITVVLFACLGMLLRVDYGAYGVIIILMFYNIKKLSTLMISIFLLNLLNILYILFISRENVSIEIQLSINKLISMISIPIIFYNKYRIEKSKKINKVSNISSETKISKRLIRLFKYSIYPLHMLVIFLINYFHLIV